MFYDDHVLVEQRVYKGHIDTPKTARSKRQVALSPNTVSNKALREYVQEKHLTRNPERQWFGSANVT